LRWSAFERRLSQEHLREYLKRLPEFEAEEKQDEAMALRCNPPLRSALEFFINWPNIRGAGALVRARSGELDGDGIFYTPAAALLESKEPLAAMLCVAQRPDFTLGNGRSSRYEHAARHLAECDSIAPMIKDWSGRPRSHGLCRAPESGASPEDRLLVARSRTLNRCHLALLTLSGQAVETAISNSARCAIMRKQMQSAYDRNADYGQSDQTLPTALLGPEADIGSTLRARYVCRSLNRSTRMARADTGPIEATRRGDIERQHYSESQTRRLASSLPHG